MAPIAPPSYTPSSAPRRHAFDGHTPVFSAPLSWGGDYASGGGGGGGAGGVSEDDWGRFKEVVVAVAKPSLRGADERGECNKEVFKQVMKKTADKVVGGYRKEGLPPPTAEDLTDSQRTKIERLANEYMVLLNKQM